ncbi:MAG: S8 family peptidase [Candidatus Shapirobacteria bacterium]|jgi:hypothetical protein
MNNILQLKGTFQQRSSDNKPGYRNIPKNATPITSKKLQSLLDEFKNLYNYWVGQNIIGGCLIDVCYTDVIAKSNRIKGFLSGGGDSINNTVVGARFANDKKIKHIITHYVGKEVINHTIENIQSCIKLLNEEFAGSITHDLIENLQKKDIKYSHYRIAKTTFCNLIVDSHYVEDFTIPDNSANTTNQSIITIYKTSVDLVGLMKKIGINVQPDKIISETTLLLYPDQITLLSEKAPYLIAMATEDLSKLSHDDIVGSTVNDPTITIDPPNGEPIIGVIDTLFDERVYFSEWVDFRKMINDEIPTVSDDYVHGTSVSSIIVDGPTINPELDDGCGRFRVRHFGVAAQGQYSSFSIMKAIKEIVVANTDIKVWNLSLGSDREINPNFISPEAAILDQIQYENDVIFVIAGTNKRYDDPKVEKMIGSPADSINAIVVNSVNSAGTPASYTRKGLVLSFFNKPDVSSFGGDTNDYVCVYTPTGRELHCGTSFAAPWVARKVAYLIEVLGLSREVAKALIVDAAAGWNGVGNDLKLAPLVGHGVVPKKIDDIVKSSDSEIKFVISGISEKWDTYTYNLPVPIHNEKHPFVAKATLCYFPSCSVNQGVDYTNTELDIYVGRVVKDGIKSINKNVQSADDGERHYIYEGNARQFYRKWDNTKHISELYTDKIGARKVYEHGLWGISIKTKERLIKRLGVGTKFGLVVTLKEINGVNRINDFTRQCELRGWLVSRVDIDNRVEIFNKAKETITFDS